MGDLKGLDLLFIRVEPLRLEQMQTIARLGFAAEQLDDALTAFPRVGMGHGHGILSGIAVAQARAAAHLDKEANREKMMLTSLWYRFQMFSEVFCSVGGFPPANGQLVLPIAAQLFEAGIHIGRDRCTSSGFPGLFQPTLTHHKDQADLLAGSKGHIFLQSGAVIARLFKAAGKLSLLHAHGVALVMIQADKPIPQGVEAIGLKAAVKTDTQTPHRTGRTG